MEKINKTARFFILVVLSFSTDINLIGCTLKQTATPRSTLEPTYTTKRVENLISSFQSANYTAKYYFDGDLKQTSMRDKNISKIVIEDAFTDIIPKS